MLAGNMPDMKQKKRRREVHVPQVESGCNHGDIAVGQAPLPARVHPLTRRDLLAAFFVWLVVIAVYCRMLPPTVTGEDSGELITAAYTLGIAHPPGYPLWCMLGKLFTFVPFGTVAWRVALMSSFLGACTAAILCLLTIKCVRSRFAGIVAGLMAALSSEFWEQSLLAEVYSLNALLMLSCMLLLVVWYEKRKAKYLYAFSIVYGLGLCNHNTMHFLGPAFALFILSVDRSPWQRWKTYVTMAGVALGIWLTVNLYLPIRSLANPPVDWGNPESWEGFWDVVMRQQYSFGFTKNPRTLSRFIAQAWVFLKLYSNEFTPWLAVVPLLGIYGLLRKSVRYSALVIGVFLYVTLGFLLILNFNVDKESIWVNNVFFIPVYLMMSILFGAAAAWLSGQSVWGKKLTLLGVALGVACVVVPFFAHFHENDKSQYYFAYDYGTNILKTLDEGAVYLPVADHATFPVLYLQAVEGMRPDVSIGNKYGYTEEELYKDMPFELRTRFGKIPGESEQAIIEDWIVANTSRPVYFTKRRQIKGLPGADIVNTGLLYRAVRPGENPPLRDCWSEYTWHTLDEADTRGEYSAELIVSDYNFFRGRDFLEEGKVDEGLRSLAAALQVAGESKESLNNVATACAEYRQLEAAERYYLKALELDPDYEMSLQNLAKVYVDQGSFEKAQALLERVIQLKPAEPEFHQLSVRCLKEMGRFDDALRELDNLAKLTPDDPQVYREMGMIYLNEKRQPQLAQRMFAESLRREPNQPDLLQQANQRPSSPESPFVGPQLPDTGVATPQLPQLPLPKLPQLPEMPRP